MVLSKEFSSYWKAVADILSMPFREVSFATLQSWPLPDKIPEISIEGYSLAAAKLNIVFLEVSP